MTDPLSAVLNTGCLSALTAIAAQDIDGLRLMLDVMSNDEVHFLARTTVEMAETLDRLIEQLAEELAREADWRGFPTAPAAVEG
ncbi:hypothetical protein [Rhodococcus sp. NPDC127528]|uniref:hypothetical protein n=1 Tax=unclassified Rhodococcus (in: high G+C Gram-positive bacteria) TaxID=192944 RepID=UPI003630AEE0